MPPVGIDAAPLPPDASAELRRWWDGVRRALPWRESRDPWAILVAEVMAQQTQVDRVVPRWRRFLDRWPTPQACADASSAEVLEEWQGLGYPRRAQRLHATARELAARAAAGEGPPDSVERWRDLPGIGDYTARALMAFAFEADVGVLDTNTGRILARVAGRRLSPRQAQEAADAAVPTGAGWAHNQAMLDLGAMVCRPNPACERCPLAMRCTWAIEGRPEPDPSRRSAGVSGRQAPFAGSIRQARGAVLRALADGPREIEVVVAAVTEVLPDRGIGSVRERVEAALRSLADDELITLDADTVQLGAQPRQSSKMRVVVP